MPLEVRFDDCKYCTETVGIPCVFVVQDHLTPIWKDRRIEPRSIGSYECVSAWKLALSVSSMNDWASPPESFLTALAWFVSENISVIREMRLSLSRI